MGTERGSSPNVSISSDGSHLLLGYPNKEDPGLKGVVRLFRLKLK